MPMPDPELPNGEVVSWAMLWLEALGSLFIENRLVVNGHFVILKRVWDFREGLQHMARPDRVVKIGLVDVTDDAAFVIEFESKQTTASLLGQVLGEAVAVVHVVSLLLVCFCDLCEPTERRRTESFVSRRLATTRLARSNGAHFDRSHDLSET